MSLPPRMTNEDRRDLERVLGTMSLDELRYFCCKTLEVATAAQAILRKRFGHDEWHRFNADIEGRP